VDCESVKQLLLSEAEDVPTTTNPPGPLKPEPAIVRYDTLAAVEIAR
jgi:hypothetical protein